MAKELILSIPDPHVEPDQDLKRFEALGRLIVDRRPSLIVGMGDWLTVQSFSPWEMRKPLKMENRRYLAEIEACGASFAALYGPLSALQAQQRRNKERIYKPDKRFLLGNHEYWVERWVEEFPQLEGFVDIVKNMRILEFWDAHYPYKHGFTHNGLSYIHSPMNKMNRPISGKYAAMRAAEFYNNSVIFGHLHRWEQAAIPRLDSPNPARALSVGCFFDGMPEWADGSPDDWWRGVVLIHQFGFNQFDPEPVSMDRLLNEYGGVMV